jgi:hypothetical protein
MLPENPSKDPGQNWRRRRASGNAMLWPSLLRENPMVAVGAALGALMESKESVSAGRGRSRAGRNLW